MKKIFISSGVLVMALTVTAIWFLKKEDGASETATRTSEVGNQKSEAIKKMALASPEEFQTQTVVKRDAPVPLAVPTKRPKQLSEVEKQGAGDGNQGTGVGRQEAERKPVAVSDLYFYKDYASMRKEEISNPDSKENRAGVVALLKARQRRAGVESE